MNKFYTYDEIRSQPEAWAQALEVVNAQRKDLSTLLQKPFEQVLFIGCGSTYYLALAGAALFQEMTGRPAKAAPASELLLNPVTILADQHTLLVAISRSGRTTETVRAVERFRQDGRGMVLAITNYDQEHLAGLGDQALVIQKGQERSVAQTRSFASMYVAATAFAGIAADNKVFLTEMGSLEKIGEKLITVYDGLARQYGEDLDMDRFYFLGSGSRYGLACELNLKMKEMTLTHSEPFHFLEFRHGPMSMVTPSTTIVGLLSERNRGHENVVLDEMGSLGARILSIANHEAEIVFDSKIHESAMGVLCLPVLQLMAYYRALAKGLNPDTPNNLSAVVQLSI